MSLDLGPAIRKTLIGGWTDLDVSAIIECIEQYRDAPAVFAYRPIPEDAPTAIILINPDVAITDADGLTSDRPIVVRDIAIYGRKGTPGDPSDQSPAIERCGYLIRNLFHRQRFSVRPEGYSVIQIRATGPIPAPVDDDGEIGRIVTLTIELRRN